jgi:bifunctional non-homologous end joining protein LigD
MPTEKEVLRINGREVTVTNPRKVYFPETGYTKLDLVNYYVAVADGALRGAGGRPMALKRFVDGAAGQPFFQKRAPENVPDFIRTATLTFPSGRTADEVVLDDAAGLAWVANLGCIDLNPHPVRAEDLDHPDELRVDLDPIPGVPWDHVRLVALATRESLQAVGLVGWPKTSGSRGIHINVRIEPRWTYSEVRRAALALARDVERRVPELATSKWWKEERHGVFLDYNQNAKDRTVASAYSVRPLPDARVSMPLPWDDVATVEAEAFTLATVPALFAAHGDAGAGIDEAMGSLEGLLELSARDESEGLGDAPWPPNYAKQAGEPPRVQPSRARRPKSEYEPGRGEAGGPPPEVAAERAAAVAAGDRNAGLPTEWTGSRPTPTGRRKTSIPVVEIARAEFKDQAMEGFERWKARHGDIVEYLEPADVLVDGMRGRSAVWYRVRVNLIHVPEAQRPGQEPLESDFDPWAGMDIEAWKAATSGSRARRPGPKAAAEGSTERKATKASAEPKPTTSKSKVKVSSTSKPKKPKPPERPTGAT